MKNDKTKTVIYILAGIIIGVTLTLTFSSGTKTGDSAGADVPKSSERKVKYWTGSMHPQVKMDHPGQCPICGMDLIPVYEGDDGGDGNVSLKLGERARKLAMIRTEPVTRMELIKDIHTVAKIDYDETRVAYISAWSNGRIDKLYADFTGIRVKKGEKLALLYSPELISAQQEFLLTYKSRGINARSKLSLLGISDSQIKKIEKAGKPVTHLTITSPITGTVIDKNIKEGQYVKTGNSLYTIADFSNLWVYLDIYEYDLSWIKLGQKAYVIVEAFPDEEFEGVITFIEPYVNEKTRTVKVRAEVKNPKMRLKPGMFASGHIHNAVLNGNTKDQKYLAVRKDAVLDTGIRKVVYVEEEEGEFKMHEIITGPLAGDFYPVVSGIKEGDKVVISGNFLIDSQMQLTGKPSIMFPGDPEKAETHDDDDMEMDDIEMDDIDMQ